MFLLDHPNEKLLFILFIFDIKNLEKFLILLHSEHKDSLKKYHISYCRYKILNKVDLI